MKVPFLLLEASAIDATVASRSGLLRRFNLDLPLLLALLTVAGLGLLVLYSAGGQSTHLLLKQSVHLALAVIVLIAVAQIPPHQLKLWAPIIFFAGLLLLLAVLAIGVVGKGAQRWLDLGFIRFQPSELMKIALPMMTAWYLSDKPLPPRLRDLLVCLLVMLIPMLLILKQPDLGTALLVTMSGLYVIFLAGLSWFIILGVIALVAVSAPLFWLYVMHDYQRQRVLTFLNPENDLLGSGWHIIQSEIAIGSGGMYGKGWLNSSQARLDFLPESSTDFVFAVFAEEFGLLGLGVLLLLYFFIVARSLYLASQAPDTFTRLLCGSLALIFFTYVFINMGMVSGLLPVVGLPLPLISYGGTAMVTIMAGFGILMSSHAHRRLLVR